PLSRKISCGGGIALPRALSFCLLMGLAVVAGDAAAQAVASSARRPVAQANALTIAPTIDGNVAGDPAWQGARAIENFWQIQPQAGQPASQRTEVYVGFTDKAL